MPNTNQSVALGVARRILLVLLCLVPATYISLVAAGGLQSTADYLRDASEEHQAHQLGLRLTDRFGAWAIPSDTVRVVDQAGLIERVFYRPSRHAVLQHRMADLPQAQVQAIQQLAVAQIAPDDPHLIETAILDRERLDMALRDLAEASFANYRAREANPAVHSADQVYDALVETVFGAFERVIVAFALGAWLLLLACLAMLPRPFSTASIIVQVMMVYGVCWATAVFPAPAWVVALSVIILYSLLVPPRRAGEPLPGMRHRVPRAITFSLVALVGFLSAGLMQLVAALVAPAPLVLQARRSGAPVDPPAEAR